MTAAVHDLMAARAQRRRQPLRFEDDVEALSFVASHLDQLRARTREELFIPSADVALTLSQVDAVIAAVADLYAHTDDRSS